VTGSAASPQRYIIVHVELVALRRVPHQMINMWVTRAVPSILARQGQSIQFWLDMVALQVYQAGRAVARVFCDYQDFS
jgi:hypothetical protein